MHGKRDGHDLTITKAMSIAVVVILAAGACKESAEEKVYPRGCYYPEECSIEEFEITINENIPDFDESKCGTSVLEESVTVTDEETLSSLFGVTHLKGNLRIVQSNLANLAALESLICVGGNVEIASNSFLTNLDGLANLQQIGGFLKVGTNQLGEDEADPNSALLNIDGLGNLTQIGTHLWITKNPLITNIDSLSQLTTSKNVVITANDALENIDGLSSLTEIRGYLKIGHRDEGNANLQNVDGLAQVTYIGSYAWISYNPSLLNLDGLNKVKWIGDYLGVFGNESLESVSGLSGLENLCGFLNIADNPKLPGCEAAQIAIDTKHNCGVCLRFNQVDTCPEQDDGCLYDRCVQNNNCDGGAN